MGRSAAAGVAGNGDGVACMDGGANGDEEAGEVEIGDLQAAVAESDVLAGTWVLACLDDFAREHCIDGFGVCTEVKTVVESTL